MAASDKQTLVRRISGAPGSGVGANAGLGTSDILIPRVPDLPGNLSPDSIASFRNDMERWRQSLQAQLPIPQNTSSSASSADIAALNSRIDSLVAQMSAFMDAVNSRLNGVGSTSTSTSSQTNYVTSNDVKEIIKNARYKHTQGQAADIWYIPHNLGWKPSVTIVDISDNVIGADVEYINENVLTVKFSGTLSGYAYLN
jgi:hypothetical protein